MNTKNVAMILCLAALVMAFVGWKQEKSVTTITVAPAITLPPTVGTVPPAWMTGVLTTQHPATGTASPTYVVATPNPVSTPPPFM